MTWGNLTLPIKHVPDAPGAYVLLKGDEIVYAGCSKRMARRVTAHRSSPCFKDGRATEVRYFECGVEEMRIVERAMICLLGPTENRNGYKSYVKRRDA